MNKSWLLGVSCLLTSLNLAASLEALPELNIHSQKVSVSGLSSGGYMAQQLHMAYSERFMAAAILAGGPYYCAENNIGLALRRCMKPTLLDMPDAERLAWLTREFEGRGGLAPLNNLRDDRVWIFSSPLDSVVHQSVADVLVDYYSRFVPAERLRYINAIGGEHAMPTDDFGHSCDHLGEKANPDDHFINNCGYDAAGELLKYSYNRLKRPNEDELRGRIIAFDQSLYLDSPAQHGMGSQGFAYVPQGCEKGKRCKLHVALHGCLQGYDRIGLTYVQNAGYNEWADSNAMVVLYPQATESLHETNGNGCWDWWGYDDADYATRQGRQMQAIMAMVNQLSRGDDNSPEPAAPERLRLSNLTAPSLTLEWDAVPGAASYAVYHAEVSGGPYLQLRADGLVVPRVSLDAPLDSTHYYVVVAIDVSGTEGGPSNEVAVTLPGL